MRSGVSPGDGVVRPDLAQATSRLEALLTETIAYRAYFAAAEKKRLLG